MASSNGTNCFVAGLTDETTSQDRDRNPGCRPARFGQPCSEKRRVAPDGTFRSWLVSLTMTARLESRLRAA